VRRTLALLAVVLLASAAGCGKQDDQLSTATTKAAGSSSSTSSSSSTAAHGPTTTADVTTITTTLVDGKPHFASPEDAMTYLAASWNANDIVSLKHVTDPSARDELNSMHGVAVNLRLNHCEANPEGDYTCYFDHDYPAHASTTMVMDDPHEGHAVFLVGPADTPGWYMTVFESCS
jgi:hypothetical protein